MSRPNEGTTFTLLLPVVRNADVETIIENTALPTGNEKILLIDDEAYIVEVVSQLLRDIEYTIDARRDSLEALNAFASNPDAYDMIITDMTMPQLTGVQLAAQIMRIRNDILIIDDDQMVCDILSTFFQSLGHEVNQTYTLAEGIQMISDGSFDLILLDVRLPDGNGLDQISRFRGVSSSPEVIIITGKELFARVIHDNSSRASQPFVVVDCASLTETLAESVLFGHTRGAFTGAEKAREGLIRMANQRTLFLDEVGELPLTLQSSFLRVLQERRFRPVGGGQEISIRHVFPPLCVD